MRSLLLGATFMLLSLCSATALAQDQSAPPPPPASSSAPPPAQVEHFQDWSVRCGAGAQGSKTNCEMVQTVNRKENNQPIMRIAIGYPPQSDNPVAIFLLPLGMRLPQGVQFSIDGGTPVSFPVQLCVTQGCRADLPLNEDLLQKLRAGSQATVTIHDPHGQPVKLPVSLIGFTAALQRISP